ncbi:MAG: Coenzyme F420 hydrogenase/dehydrogenase, beta subunit C-terminal domain [Firmicutes bacterium]|nr:Coenzyme F420 hydrogenase/dehydrogenase, beta subunit C-terminal domain [Bacillota bacterium]
MNNLKMSENQTNKNIPILYEIKADCCGCGACLNICPCNAIAMEEDDYGFLYPTINKKLCIGCGACKRVCAYQNSQTHNVPLLTYAAVNKNIDEIMYCASGGIFTVVAKMMLKKGGVVFGASFTQDWNVKHIKADSIQDLKALQGSKYLQSDTNTTYSQVKQELLLGRSVLYSGTPCQIAGLYGYLGEKYDRLYTTDVICHGVPNNRMFCDYLKQIENSFGGKIKKFTFRDKALGWGINGSIVIKTDTKLINKVLWESESPYLYYFTKGQIFRENCYKCKYACPHRPADLTLGDYWGIEKAHPEYIEKNGWDEKKGISAVIVNTEKGRQMVSEIEKYAELKPSHFEKVAAGNTQLRKPSTPGNREAVLEVYKNGGWSAVESMHKKIGLKKYTSRIKALIPQNIKNFIKKHK